MVASIQPACLVYRVQMRPAFIHPRIDISGRLANLKASANRSRNHIRFNHARFNSVQQQTLPAAFVADIFGRYPLRLRKWPNSRSVADLLFLEAWELDRSMVDPATLLRIRQIRRANPKLSAEITEELTRRRCKTGAKSAATAVPILYNGIQTRS